MNENDQTINDVPQVGMNEHNQAKSDVAQTKLKEKIEYFEDSIKALRRKKLSLDGLPRDISEFLDWNDGDLTQTNKTYLYSDRNKDHLVQVRSLIEKVKAPAPQCGDDIKALKSEVKTLKKQLAGVVDANRDLRELLKSCETNLSGIKP